MAKEKTGFLQCSYRLLDEVGKTDIAVLGHKIYYKWQTGNRGKDGFIQIKDAELMNTIKISSSTTMRGYVAKLEEIGLIKTKRLNGSKLYKVNLVSAKKYFK